MNINEAIEAMKIVAPHASALEAADDGLSMVRALFHGFQANSEEENFGRLLALMQHRHIDEVTADFSGAGGPAEMLAPLVQCLAVNSVPDLVNGAYLLGLSAIKWEDNG